jgi:hypothetical protein
VIKTILMGSLLTVALVFAGQPAKAAWLCGPEQCVWVHHPVAAVPAFAATWGPPINARCFWRRGVFGRWRFVCP